jgi:hypothetical protein
MSRFPSRQRLSTNGSFDSLLAWWEDLLVQGQSLEPSLLQQLPESLRQRLSADLDVLLQLQSLKIPKQVGDFTIVRELGSGGFGTVYLAYDETLHRQVALKVPHVQYLSNSQARIRFLYEARAAAYLQHPHVLPVYLVGEAGPFCYIATEYCAAGSLAEWLKAQPSPASWRDAAHLVALLADAVQHAHDRGVLHRDLKPGNVLLKTTRRQPSPSLGEYVPLLADFGLAVHAQEADDESTNETVLGTPGYIAPELLGGVRNLSTAGDIYGLGAILYECLTGKPPHQAFTPQETLALARAEEPVSPRQIRGSLPHPIAAICEKCLKRSPSDRYPSAAALQKDLQACLRGDAVEAYPAGYLETGIRWARRHPAYTVLFLALITFAGVGLAAGIWHYYQMDQALQLAETRRGEAVTARLEAETSRLSAKEEGQIAEQNFERVNKALADIVDAIDTVVQTLPTGHQATRSVLEMIISTFTEMSVSYQKRPMLKVHAAETNLRLARTLRQIGLMDQAREKLSNSQAELRQLHELHPHDKRIQIAQASCYQSLGFWYLQQGGMKQAEEQFKICQGMLSELVQRDPKDANLRALYAACLEAQGVIALRAFRASDAEGYFRKVLEIRASLGGEDPPGRAALAATKLNVGTSLLQQRKLAQAEKLLLETEMELNQLLNEQPDNVNNRFYLNRTYSALSRVYVNSPKKAIIYLDKAVNNSRLLAFPQGPLNYRQEYGLQLNRLAEAYYLSNDFVLAQQAIQKAMEIAQHDRALRPSDSSVKLVAMSTLGIAARIHSSSGTGNPELLFAEAIALGEELQRQGVYAERLQFELASISLFRAKHHHRVNDSSTARKHLVTAADRMKKLLAEQPRQPMYVELSQEIEKLQQLIAESRRLKW